MPQVFAEGPSRHSAGVELLTGEAVEADGLLEGGAELGRGGAVELLSSTRTVLMDRGTHRRRRLVHAHSSSAMSSSDHELPCKWPSVRCRGGEYAPAMRMHLAWLR